MFLQIQIENVILVCEPILLHIAYCITRVLYITDCTLAGCMCNMPQRFIAGLL